VISVQPQNTRYQTATASPSSLSVKASSPDGGVLSYQWYSSTKPFNSGGSPISGAKGSTYTPSANNYAVNYYYVVVTNTNNNVSGVKTASVASRVAEVAVGTKVSFYDANLDFNASIGVDTSSPTTIDIASLKTSLDLNATALYRASSTDDVIGETSYPITSDTNFYADLNVTEITTQAGLANINASAATLSGKYMLLNGIALDQSGAGFEGAYGWKPIGDYSNPFTGILNGNGHKITGLWIDRPSEEYVGLFGFATVPVIKNIGVEIPNGKTVKGYYLVGGIVGYIEDTITNSYVTGDIIGYQCVGGIAGFALSGITNSYATGNISGYTSVGGIVGYTKGAITNSYTTGNISGYDRSIGGIAGSSEGAITNSYTTGDVSGYSDVGGIAGITNRDITNSYATGNISGTGDHIGGITGNANNGAITNSYATGNISGSEYVGGIVGETSGDITNSYTTGDVRGHQYVGGIVGNAYNSSPITNSYATGNISGTSNVGGIAGETDSDITNSYAAGNISGYYMVGGIAGMVGSSPTIENSAAINQTVSATYDVDKIVGYINGSPTISNNFALDTMSIAPNGSGGNGGDADKTIVELKTKSTYETDLSWKFGSDDSNPWKIDANKNGGLPYLYYQDQ
jgi:hypothetical protein